MSVAMSPGQLPEINHMPALPPEAAYYTKSDNASLVIGTVATVALTTLGLSIMSDAISPRQLPEINHMPALPPKAAYYTKSDNAFLVIGTVAAVALITFGIVSAVAYNRANFAKSLGMFQNSAGRMGIGFGFGCGAIISIVTNVTRFATKKSQATYEAEESRYGSNFAMQEQVRKVLNMPANEAVQIGAKSHAISVFIEQEIKKNQHYNRAASDFTIQVFYDENTKKMTAYDTLKPDRSRYQDALDLIPYIQYMVYEHNKLADIAQSKGCLGCIGCLHDRVDLITRRNIPVS